MLFCFFLRDIDLNFFHIIASLASLQTRLVQKLSKYTCSTQMSIKIVLLINAKMQTNVVVLTFMSTINTTSGCFKQEILIICQYFGFMSSSKAKPISPSPN